MRRVLVTVWVCVVAVLSAAAAHAQTTHALSGTVFGGGSPLQGAVVDALQDGTTTVVASSTTDSGGHYSMALADATYDLRVTPPSGSGFNVETVQNVTMSGADRTYDVVLLSSQAGIISGTVRGLNGQPIADVWVTAYVSPSSQSTQTDSSGHYSLVVGNGTASMEFSKIAVPGVAPAFYLQRYGIAVNGPTTVDISLSVAQVSGVVKDPDGHPVAGANVYLSSYDYPSNGRNSSSGSVTSGADGSYSTLSLTGNVNATITPPAGSALVATSASFAVPGDTQQDFTLGAAVTISGTVRGRNGQPVPNVWVTAYVSPSSTSTQTDSNGHYSLLAGNGTASMEFSSAPVTGIAPSFYVQRYSIVVSGPTTVDVDLSVVQVTGIVKGPDGQAVAGANVYLSSYEYPSNGRNSSSGSATTGADGSYSMLALAGTANATITPPTGSALVAASASFSVAGDTQQDFTLGAAVTISGTVRGRNGQPIPNAWVTAYVSPSSTSTQTDSDGHYSLLAGTGTASMEFSSAPVAGVAPSFYSQRYGIVVSGPTTVDLDLNVVQVTGSVTDSNGAPVPGVSVYTSTYTYPANGRDSSSASASSQSDGSYSYLLLAGYGSLNITPPPATGFLQAALSVTIAGDLTQRIILQHPDLAPPQITAGPFVVHLSDTSVSISWTTNEASTSIVQYGLGSLSLSAGGAALTTDHTVTLAGLQELSHYDFRVGSRDEAGNGPTYSAAASFDTQGAPGDITPPVITSGPTVVFVDQTTAIVEWTTDEPASSLVDVPAPGVTIDGDPGHFQQLHHVKITGLSPDTDYRAVARSADPDGNEIASSAFPFHTLAVPDTTAPVIIDGPTAISKNDTKIVLGWTTNEPATSGVSYNDGTHFDLASDTSLTKSHQMTLSGLSPSTTYHITVSATDAVGNGPTLSAVLDVTTDATPDTTAPVISSVQVSGITTHEAVISWTTDEPASALLKFGLTAGAPDDVRADLTASTSHSLSLTGLQDGTTYYFVVVATDASGNAATSSERAFKTDSAFVDQPPTAPGPISAPASPTRAATIQLSWGGSTDDVGVAGYDVLRDGGVIGSVAPDTTSFSDSAAAEGSHTYQVRASDTAGHTAVSAPLTLIVDRTAPVLALPAGITADASGTAAVVSYTASAADNVDAQVAVTCAPASGSAFAVGVSTVSCSASDAAGNTATDSFSVTVRDVTPPDVTVPSDITREATSPAGAAVTFTTSAADAVDGAIQPVCDPASGSTFALGRTTVSCSARDAAGNVGTRTFTVTVVDTTAPVVTVFAPSQPALWPANHQMVPLTLRVAVSDAGDAAPVCRIVSIASNEPVNGTGDGDTAPDWTFAGLSFSLRAERSGTGSGRVYTIAGECRDGSGNVTTASTAVLVPKSQSNR